MMFFDVLERRQLLAAQYSLTLLAPATGTSSSHANAINESNIVKPSLMRREIAVAQPAPMT